MDLTRETCNLSMDEFSAAAAANQPLPYPFIVRVPATCWLSAIVVVSTVNCGVITRSKLHRTCTSTWSEPGGWGGRRRCSRACSTEAGSFALATLYSYIAYFKHIDVCLSGRCRASEHDSNDSCIFSVPQLLLSEQGPTWLPAWPWVTATTNLDLVLREQRWGCNSNLVRSGGVWLPFVWKWIFGRKAKRSWGVEKKNPHSHTLYLFEENKIWPTVPFSACPGNSPSRRTTTFPGRRPSSADAAGRIVRGGSPPSPCLKVISCLPSLLPSPSRAKPTKFIFAS